MKSKTTVAIIVAALAFGCAKDIRFIERESFYNSVDFTKYTNMGFLITTEGYDYPYESIGIVRYTFVPQARYGIVSSRRLSDGTVQHTNGWMTEPRTTVNGLDSLYLLARNMGGDAIINLKVTEVVRTHTTSTQLLPVTLSGLEYSGYAIRRKEK